jgi:soluble P-type ATPase
VPVIVPRGDAELVLDHVVLDVNGTLTVQGGLVPGAAERLDRLRERIELLLVSADTHGTLQDIARALGVPARRVGRAEEKAAILAELGPARCAAIGNGRNDRLLLRDAALGIAVCGAEGMAAEVLGAADVVCGSVIDALDLLLHPERIWATLRP